MSDRNEREHKRERKAVGWGVGMISAQIVEPVTHSSHGRLQCRSYCVITSLLNHYCRFENVLYSVICQSELPC